MHARSKRMHLLLPLLALSLTLAIATSAQAQYRRSSDPAVSLQINFGSAPHFVGIRGTNIRAIRQSDRSDYDMFRYGRFYYAYNNENDRWYRSRRYSGRFRLISDRDVPRQLRRIPRDHWRNYPTAWGGNRRDDYQGSGGSYATFQVSFGSAPRWSSISGSRVEVIPYEQRPSYDVFRYGGSYYAYNNNRRYSSSRESGQFNLIEERSVPSELTSVPRAHWRNYPAAWGNNGNGRGNNGNGRGNNGNGNGNGNGRDGSGGRGGN